MALKLRFYKCSVCGNIIQVLIDGAGELVCCGQEMDLLEPKCTDEGSEKHVPCFEINEENSAIIKVGCELHPMSDTHYIQFIENISPDKRKLYLEFFEPGDIPQISNVNNTNTAYEYCNIHGLWEGNND